MTESVYTMDWDLAKISPKISDPQFVSTISEMAILQSAAYIQELNDVDQADWKQRPKSNSHKLATSNRQCWLEVTKYKMSETMAHECVADWEAVPCAWGQPLSSAAPSWPWPPPSSAQALAHSPHACALSVQAYAAECFPPEVSRLASQPGSYPDGKALPSEIKAITIQYQVIFSQWQHKI